MKRDRGKIFILFTLTVLAISVLVPIFWVASASVKEDYDFYRSPFALPSRLDFENFSEAWKEAGMGRYFLNSVTVTALSLAILLCTAVPCAWALGRFNFRGKSFFRIFFMAGLFINVSYLVVPIFLMLTDINRLIGENVTINNLFVLAIVYASCALPFTVYLLTSYFSSIPKECEEAAAVDGAGRLYTMVKITVPMARPAIVTAVLFNFLSFWNEYIIAVTLITDDKLKTLPVGLLNLMKAQNASARYGRMYAGLVLVMIPTLLLYILVQKKLTDGISLGGSKG